jgi:hypothetical protein
MTKITIERELELIDGMIEGGDKTDRAQAIAALERTK